MEYGEVVVQIVKTKMQFPATLLNRRDTLPNPKDTLPNLKGTLPNPKGILPKPTLLRATLLLLLLKVTLPNRVILRSMSPNTLRHRPLANNNPAALVVWKDVWPHCVVAASWTPASDVNASICSVNSINNFVDGVASISGSDLLASHIPQWVNGLYSFVELVSYFLIN
nr:hypothetical protein AXF42_Ash015768 [Ipomoea batatas]